MMMLSVHSFRAHPSSTNSTSLYPFHICARMLRIGVDRVRTKFRVESTKKVQIQQRMDKLVQISRG